MADKSGRESRAPQELRNQLPAEFQQTVTSSPSAQSYRPGDTVPASGIYLAAHFGEYRQRHDVVLGKNEKFPWCEVCEDKVHYSLLRAAPFATEDEDFRNSTADSLDGSS